MKIPALRSKMGDWTYYVSTITFGQVKKYVSRVDEELHKSESLKELIQRSVSNNYVKIKDYIVNQKELFFNAIVLAVYNDYPIWHEIEVEFEDLHTFQMGLLEFPGTHKIFPVDGQHRVEGIKAALDENAELESQIITAIFIGHKNDDAGMKRTRRLFTTLNRYAKPVSMDDIIALDEDDSIAIITRELLESYDLFTGKRVTKSKNKAILESDKNSITSIITLYQCNKELLKLFRLKRKAEAPDAIRDKKTIEEYLKFRPKEEEINLFLKFATAFWNSFKKNLDFIEKYLEITTANPAAKFRTKIDGGNLLFRPIGLLPFIQAAIEIHKRTQSSFSTIFKRLNLYNYIIKNAPWKGVVWNTNEKTMIMNNSGIVKLLLLYIYGKDVIKAHELKNLKEKYSDRLNLKNVSTSLSKVKKIE